MEWTSQDKENESGREDGWVVGIKGKGWDFTENYSGSNLTTAKEINWWRSFLVEETLSSEKWQNSMKKYFNLYYKKELTSNAILMLVS